MLHFFLRNIHRPILSDPLLACFSDRSIRPQDAQKGQPTRPQEARAPRRTWWVYVEGLERPRTTLGAFFSIVSFYGHAFRQVSRLITIRPSQHRHMIVQYL